MDVDFIFLNAAISKILYFKQDVGASYVVYVNNFIGNPDVDSPT